MKSYCKGLVLDEARFVSAIGEWRGSQSGRKNWHRVEQEHGSARALAARLAEEVRERRLMTRPIARHLEVDPSSGKVRDIGIASVKQQVLDYAVIGALMPMFERHIGRWQMAGIRGRGQLRAALAVRRWARRRDAAWFAQLDIRKFYPSVPHSVVMGLLRKYVRSDDVLYTTSYLLSTYGDGVGLNIGSALSIWLGNWLLSFAYHHLESLGKVRRGRRVSLVTHQVWYLDDHVVWARSKRDLKVAVRSLVRFVGERLGVSHKPWKPCLTAREPVNLCGYPTTPVRVRMRGRTFLRARRAFRRFLRRPGLSLARRVISYWGFVRHADARRFAEREMVPLAVSRARRLVSTTDRGSCQCA